MAPNNSKTTKADKAASAADSPQDGPEDDSAPVGADEAPEAAEGDTEAPEFDERPGWVQDDDGVWRQLTPETVDGLVDLLDRYYVRRDGTGVAPAPVAPPEAEGSK